MGPISAVQSSYCTKKDQLTPRPIRYVGNRVNGQQEVSWGQAQQVPDAVQQAVRLFRVQQGGCTEHSGQAGQVQRADARRKLVLKPKRRHRGRRVGLHRGGKGGDHIAHFEFVGDLICDANGDHTHDNGEHEGEQFGDFELEALRAEQADEGVHGHDYGEEHGRRHVTCSQACEVNSSNDDEGDGRGPGTRDAINDNWHTSCVCVNMNIMRLTLSLPSSKSTFSQPFQEKCISEVVRTGTRIIFQSE